MELALARVQAGADLEAQRRDAVPERGCAADRACGAVEGGEEAVPGRVDLVAAEALELAADGNTVGLEQLAPAAVAEVSGELGRADEVGEEDRREHAVGLRGRAHAGQELTDLREREIGQPAYITWSAPGSSTKRAPGIVRAR